MKKYGFTLAECLIALLLIGVISAVMAPAIRHLFPDKDKTIVLKYNKIIMDINNEIKDDRAIWQNENPNSAQTGWNRHLISSTSYKDLLPEYLHIVNSTLVSSASSTKFDTIDGLSWEISKPANSIATITIDLNNDKQQRCTYNKNNCTKPGQFKFYIDAETLNISGGDPLTAAYLANPHKLNNNDSDYKAAESDTETYSY